MKSRKSRDRRERRAPSRPLELREAAAFLRITNRQMAQLLDGFQVLTLRKNGRRLVPASEIQAQRSAMGR